MASAACAGSAKNAEAESAESDAASPTNFERGLADLFPKSNSQVRGSLVFRQGPDGLQIGGHVQGLEGGRFAISIHESNDCSAHDASSVGKVFDPTASSPPRGLVGDVVAKEGASNSAVELVAPELELNGPSAVLGHAVVIHAWPTDPKVDWTRVPFLACGVIEGG